MKKIQRTIYRLGLIALAFCFVPVCAQVQLPNKDAALVLFPRSTKNVGYKAQTICLDVLSNVDYSVTTSDSWLSVKKLKNNAYLTVKTNVGPSARTATVTFKMGKRNQILTIVQSRNGAAEYVTGDNQIKVKSATDNNHQNGYSALNMIDNDVNTLYHSKWSVHDVTPENPAILTYTFEGNNHIDYINYIPRSNGSNGNFGEFSISYKLQGDANYRLLGNYDFEKSGTASRINLGKKGLDNVVDVKFEVKTGGNSEGGEGSYVACAEMQFFTIVELESDYAVFTDNSFSELTPSVTQAVVDTLTNPFVKILAQQLLDGTYSKNYRVNTYSCLLAPQTLSEEWNTPGKLYDQIQGVTGIMMEPGKALIAVSGIPDGKSLGLRVIGWDKSEEYNASKANGDKNPSGGGPTEESYPLKNGTNLIDRGSLKNALAYITYYDATNPDAYGDVKVHFVNGIENGYLSPEKTNAEMQQILNKASYGCIDCFGSKVHSVWTVKGLKAYAKDENKNAAYRRYLNVLDTLIAWEHRLLGFEKYNRIPKNKTMAYVNYSYYMFQGSFGVSFMFDVENRSCSPENIMKHDDDVVWGLSHEWGHQHQMQPYFCWAGLSESSNNMNSCYNVLHMGYKGQRIIDNWAIARKIYLNDGNDGNVGKGKISQNRKEAYTMSQSANSPFGWNPKIQAMAEAMKDSLVHSQTDETFGADRAASINECYVEQNLAPFFMLHCYFSQSGFPDYTPDLYEALRKTDVGADKYELIAGAQNAKPGRFATLASQHPKSCWITQKYVSESSSRWQNSVPYIFNYIRKASKITGYNLYPYFEQWGFLRLVALHIDDYGSKYYCMLKDMKDEFKTDMEAMGLKEMTPNMVHEIATISIPKYDTPNIPN
ncbi:MAG: M60 family metallopeptidase [Bacteroidaceae bacterium]